MTVFCLRWFQNPKQRMDLLSDFNDRKQADMIKDAGVSSRYGADVASGTGVQETSSDL